jgi:NhaA family Na+:H+ antiporter
MAADREPTAGLLNAHPDHRNAGPPPRTREPILAVRFFTEFARLEASSGVFLMAAAAAALLWANSPFADRYFGLWSVHLTVALGDSVFDHDLRHWVNDGLMALFFLLVGLEIKREIRGGELSDPRKAALPVAAALGGMLVPAGIFLLLNQGMPSARGWGIPVATDIAFALGVLALVGRRAPVSLKIFLTAYAIVDDIGAVVIIAFFYNLGLSAFWLAAGAGVLGALFLANRLGVRSLAFYGLLGLALWAAVMQSGVHPTLAGVLLAFAIPWQEGRSPTQRLEHGLHPWVNYAVLPIFALANAGVQVDPANLSGVASPLGFGIMLGLVLGKPAGILLATWATVRLGVAQLPSGVRWTQIGGAAVLGGIGFTMSIFIATLGFGANGMLETAKLAIFLASGVAALAGWLLLRGASGTRPRARGGMLARAA